MASNIVRRAAGTTKPAAESLAQKYRSMGYAVNVRPVGNDRYDVYTSSTPLESAKPKPVTSSPAPRPRTATAVGKPPAKQISVMLKPGEAYYDPGTGVGVVTPAKKTEGVKPLGKYVPYTKTAFIQSQKGRYKQTIKAEREWQESKAGIRDKPSEIEVTDWLSAGETPVTAATYKQYEYITVQDKKYYTEGKTFDEFIGGITTGSVLYYTDIETDKQVRASDIKEKYYSDADYKQILKSKDIAYESWQAAKNIPSYVKITGVPSKGTFKFEEDLTEKAKEEYKSLSPFQQVTRAWWTAVAYTPKYAIETVISPVTKRPQKDIQKEMIQWESGTWKHAKEAYAGEPLPFVKDVALSPTMQEVYITLATAGLAKAATPLSKGLLRSGVRTYTKISRFIPEEHILGKGLTKVGSTAVSTKVGGRIYKWGVEGYRFGYKAGARTTAQASTKVATGWTKVERIPTRTVIGGKGKLQRVFMSPKEYQAAQATLKELTTKQAGTTISKRIGQTDVIIQSDFKRSLWSGRLTGKTTRISGSFIDEPLEQKAVSLASKYSGFEREVGKKSIITQLKGIGTTKLKPYLATYRTPHKIDMFAYRISQAKQDLNIHVIHARSKIPFWLKYKKIVQPLVVTPGTRRTKIKAFKSMIVKVGDDPLHKVKSLVYKTADDPIKEDFARRATTVSKGWQKGYIKKYPMKYLYQSKEATAQIAPSLKTETITTMGRMEGETGGRLGLVLKSQQYSIPAVDVTSKLAAGLYLGAKSITRHKQELEPVVFSIPEVKREVAMVAPPFPVAQRDIDIVTVPMVTPAFKTVQAQEALFVSIQKQEQIFGVAPVTATVLKEQKFDYGMPTAPSGAFPFFIRMPLYGRGAKQPRFELWGKVKKYREKKTFDPFDVDLGGF